MSERVGTVEHRRRLGTQCTQRVAAGEEIAHERLSTRDQLVREHVPRPRLEAAVTQQRGDLGTALGSHRQVVVEHDRLTVEEEARSRRRRIVEQLVDHGDEAMSETARGMVPLAVPVGVGDDEHTHRRRHARSVCRARRQHKPPDAARGANPKAAPREGPLVPSVRRRVDVP
jgi:hypothetical protein